MRRVDDGSGSENEQRPARASNRKDAREANGNVNANGSSNGKNGKSVAEDDGPACQSCRKKKAKCSRRDPCSQCVKLNLDCLYDDRKTRPGLRTGAVESLTQRVVALENMFLGQGVLWQQVWNCLAAIQGQSPTNHSPDNVTFSGGELEACTSRLRTTLSQLSPGMIGQSDSKIMESRPLKRQRDIGDTGEDERRLNQSWDSENENISLPPDDLVDDLVEIYFTNVHPWIPILHVKQFRERMANPIHRRKLTTIFHAITSLCVRFSDDPRLRSAEVRNRCTKRCRQNVILQSMESFSVENLQALVIIAFDTIGSGRGPSAWSIVGSMTRTVEQLQLSVEEDDDPHQTESAEFLIQRMAFLVPPKTWIEREEQRRVFWNVFLMDRFCSIATGWNFSLTSADVRRRLPCEGALWEQGIPLSTPTPYFGVADKSTNGSLANSRPDLEDQASLGGFAYAIEAAESLSLVTMFFLQHAVNFSKVHDVQMWLMRFKELDLRLVQWKIFLPPKWREASVLNADGILDPNLTLAHITHNTAVILLHQGIAYPSPQWQASQIRVPSTSSAETCMAAAAEISIIAEKYLQGSTSLTNPQFAFCLFITGRMLLAHALHYRTELTSEFGSLINSLMEISRRWDGPHAQFGSEDKAENLASKFALRLVQAREQGPKSLDIRQAAFSEEQNHASVKTRSGEQATPKASSMQGTVPSHNQTDQHVSQQLENNDMKGRDNINSEQLNTKVLTDTSTWQSNSPDSISLAFPPLPLSFQPYGDDGGFQTVTQSPMAAGNTELEESFNNESLYPANVYQNLSQEINVNNSGGSVNGSNGLTSFFEYNFLPMQRISMFSGPAMANEEGKVGDLE